MKTYSDSPTAIFFSIHAYLFPFCVLLLSVEQQKLNTTRNKWAWTEWKPLFCVRIAKTPCLKLDKSLSMRVLQKTFEISIFKLNMHSQQHKIIPYLHFRAIYSSVLNEKCIKRKKTLVTLLVVVSSISYPLPSVRRLSHLKKFKTCSDISEASFSTLSIAN